MTPEEQQQKLNELIEQFNLLSGGMGLTSDAIKRMNEMLLLTNRVLQRTPEYLKKHQEAEEALEKAEKQREHTLRQGQQVVSSFSAAMTGAVGAVGGFIAGLSQGKPSLTMFNQGLNTVGDTFVSVGKELGPIGAALGYLGKAATELAELQLSISQTYMDGRDKLIKLGGAGAITADKMKQMAAAADVNYLTLDRLIKPLQGLGKNVLVLGDNVGAAQIKFSELAATTEQERAKFIRLGVTQEDLIQNTADYIELQSYSGRILRGQALDAERLKKAHQDYLIATLALTAVTGESAEEQKKNHEALLTDRNFQLKQMELTAQRVQLERQADLPGTTAEARRALLAQSQEIQRQIESNQVLVTALSESGNLPAARAMEEYIATGSYGPQSAGLTMLGNLGPQLDELIRKNQQGAFAGLTEEQKKDLGLSVRQGTHEAFIQSVPLFGQSMRLDPALSKLLFGEDVEYNKAFLREAGRNLRTDYKGAVGETKTTLETPTPEAELQAKAQQAQIDTGKYMENMANKLMPLPEILDRLSYVLGGLTLALGVLGGVKIASFFKGGGFLGRGGLGVGGGALPGTGGIIAAEGAAATGTAAAAKLTAAEAAQVGPEFMASLAAKQGATTVATAGAEAAAATVGAEVAGETVATGLLAKLGLTGTLTAGTAVASGGLAIGGALASAGGDYLTEKGYKKTGAGVDILGDVMTGAGLGATGGALFGGIGAVPGALIGGAGGLLYGIGKWGKQLMGANEAAEDSIEKDKELQKVLPKLVDSALALDKAFRLLAQTVGSMSGHPGAGAGAAAQTPAGAAPGGASGAAPGAPGAAPGAVPDGVTQQQLQSLGLKLKSGDVQADGARIDPILLRNAKMIQDSVAGFSQFTAFNDEFHQKNKPRSSHAHGSALDFTLDKKPTREEGMKIKRQLESMGFSYVQDEYNFPSEGATGGHIHVQLARGGLVSGPNTGFPATLHGNEIVVPLNPNSMLVELGQKSRQELQNINQIMNVKNTSNDGYKEILGQNQTMMTMIANKLDKVIDHLGDSNTTQTKILRYTQA